MTDQFRYADGPTAEVSAVISATPAQLWPHVSDINLSRRFSTEFQGADWSDGYDGPAVGARFRGRNEHPVAGRWEVDCVVTECEAERVLAWQVGLGGDPAASWRFTLEPADGGTRVTQWCRMGPGPSGLSAAIERMPDREHDIVARRLDEHRANMVRNLDGLAELVAGGDG